MAEGLAGAAAEKHVNSRYGCRAATRLLSCRNIYRVLLDICMQMRSRPIFSSLVFLLAKVNALRFFVPSARCARFDPISSSLQKLTLVFLSPRMQPISFFIYTRTVMSIASLVLQYYILHCSRRSCRLLSSKARDVTGDRKKRMKAITAVRM